MNCPRIGCKNKANIDHTYGVLPCTSCQKKDEITINHVRRSPEFYTISMRDRIVHQRDQFAKDIIQPFDGVKPNPEFVRAYPELRDQYFTPEQLKNI